MNRFLKPGHDSNEGCRCLGIGTNHRGMIRMGDASAQVLARTELVSSLRYKLACAFGVDSNQSAPSDRLITALVLRLKTVDLWLSIERTSKTLIRLRGWAVIRQRRWAG